MITRELPSQKLTDFLLNIALPGLVALALAVMITRSASLAIFAVGAALVLTYCIRKPLVPLAIIILLIPFSFTTLFRDPIVKLPGAKPALILGAFAIAIAVFNYKDAVRMPRLALILATFVLGMFTLSIFRSLSYLNMINDGMIEEKVSMTEYFLSYLIKPGILYFAPFVIIAKFTFTRHHIRFLIDVVTVALLVFSGYFLYYYIFNVPDKGNIGLAWEYSSEALGLHKNVAAGFYTTAFPLVLSRFFVKKDFVSIAALFLSIPSVAFLYSRTTYVTVLVAFFGYFIISKRTKYLPFLIVLALLLSLDVPSSIIERASKGFESGDINEVAAGRIEMLWLPLVEEYLNKPVDLFFGQGRYALLATTAYQSGFLFGNSHPHNMYLEQVLDVGLIGLAVFLFLLVRLVMTCYSSIRYIKDVALREYQIGIVVCMICFLMAGMTASTLFPDIESSYFWIISCIGLAISHHFGKGEGSGANVGQADSGENS